MMLLARVFVLVALAVLTAYLLYRAEIRLFPLEKWWETEVPAGRASAESAVRNVETSIGHVLDERLAGSTPGNAFLLEWRWSVSETPGDTSRVRLVYRLRPAGFGAWLAWKFTVERRYAEEARSKVRAVKKLLSRG